MEDRLKYRLVVKKTKEVIYPRVITFHYENDIVGFIRNIESEYESFNIKDVVVEQCLGKKDRNGTLIYENDRAKIEYERLAMDSEYVGDKFIKESIIKIVDKDFKYNNKAFKIERIGNIHEVKDGK